MDQLPAWKPINAWTSSQESQRAQQGSILECKVCMDRATLETIQNQNQYQERYQWQNANGADLSRWVCWSLHTMSRLQKTIHSTWLEYCHPSEANGRAQKDFLEFRAKFIEN